MVVKLEPRLQRKHTFHRRPLEEGLKLTVLLRFLVMGDSMSRSTDLLPVQAEGEDRGRLHLLPSCETNKCKQSPYALFLLGGWCFQGSLRSNRDEWLTCLANPDNWRGVGLSSALAGSSQMPWVHLTESTLWSVVQEGAVVNSTVKRTFIRLSCLHL